MNLTPLAIAILSLSKDTRPLARFVEFITTADAEDAKLRALQPGESTVIEIPDKLDLKVKTRSGKRLSVDALVVKRLED